MTGLTVFFYSKCSAAVVTCSTRITLLHLFHRRFLVLAATWHEDAGVAFRTLVHAGMDIMTKDHSAAIVFEGYIAGGMTFGAIPFD